ncbi:MAG: TylF/MycF/NovP-related O-methyltransferase [Thermoleophilaceae bacterium]
MQAYRSGLALHGRLWDGRYTMLSSRRGRALHRLARELEAATVPGALVDCGVWNGGSSILMAAGAPNRDVWAFDSFAGLPEPSPVDGRESSAFAGACVGSEEMLREGIERFTRGARLHVRAGWFEDTFPAAVGEIGPIALLHCDGDWYESVRLTLERFYPGVAAGGYVVIDDYGAWPGARRAVEEYRARIGDRTPLRRVDHTGRYWRKPGSIAAS